MAYTDFIEKIAPIITEVSPRYGIKCNSAVIAQAILESGWGESTLAAKYHNYFGLKCGTLWSGKSVCMTTNEEFSPGEITTINDNFRAYDSMLDGVIGYFEFIQLPRYSNLKGISDPQEYLQTIWNDGYATSYSYVTDCMRLVNQYDLRKYDGDITQTAVSSGVTANDVISLARKYLGRNEYDGSHREIIDTYNSHRPLAINYTVSYSDAWCDTFISFLFIKLNATELIGGTECGVERHIELFKQAGIWEEDGSIVPKPGYLITYNWDQNYQPNNGYADHIGLVESVNGNMVTLIEGNVSDSVDRRTVTVGDGNIRGYAKPKYASESSSAKPEVSNYSLLEIAEQVIDGKWGNGSERFEKLKEAGYNPNVIQMIVNDVLSGIVDDIETVSESINELDRDADVNEIADLVLEAVRKRVKELLSK